MKMTLFYMMILALISNAKAQETPMNPANVLLSRRAVTKPPASGWFQLTADDKAVEGLTLKPIQVFQIAPNPATNVVTLSQPRDKATVGIWQIFDSADNLVWSQKVTEKDIDTNVGIQNLSEGIYFVSFMVNGERRFNQKFIKIKSN